MPLPLLCALGAACFIWLMTALGAMVVLFTPRLSPRFQVGALGLTAGIMLAACFWSLINPALALCQERSEPGWPVASCGVLAGAGFLMLTDWLLRRYKSQDKNSGSLLLLSITLHNIPEGLAVGVAFGTLQGSYDPAALAAAFSVALGIGIQNIPEGAAVALPLRKSGLSSGKSFLLGLLSGSVEPLAAFLGATLVIFVNAILPFSLCFAAGAMLYVIVQEILPEAISQSPANSRLCLCSTLAGFVLMMILDVALG